jgi:hypothetical protein
MKIIIRIIVFLFVIAFVAPVLVLAYFGFIPGLSSVFGANKPKDLGVTYTSADYTSTHDKIGTQVIKLEKADSIKDSIQFSGKKETKVDLSSAEISAYLNASKWVYAPGSNIQVKINQDGTGEISGLLNIRNFIAYVSLTTPSADIQQAIDKFHIPASAPFYAKGTLSVINNKVNMNIQSLEVGRIPVPAGNISENMAAVNNFATDKLNSIPNLKVRSLTLSASQAHLDATVPEKVSKLEK